MLDKQPKIRIRGLNKSFNDNPVLNGIDLDISQGESIVVIGGSGVGKSVLLKNIIGLLTPDSGSIKIDGNETAGMEWPENETILKRFGMLFQNGALFDSLTVWENIAFGLIQGRRMKRKEAKEIAIEKLRDVGLKPDIGFLSPAQLSGGMHKRVGLARAIATEPEIIFFDEPTTGLDPIMGDVINDLIVDCVKRLKATALSITHDMESARKIADKIAMIYKGRIIWSGPVSDIDNTGNDVLNNFIQGDAKRPVENGIGAD
jgi:phospholipid/cholesterol/gamma-HCH transport system ATP-binding protein